MFSLCHTRDHNLFFFFFFLPNKIRKTLTPLKEWTNSVLSAGKPASCYHVFSFGIAVVDGVHSHNWVITMSHLSSDVESWTLGHSQHLTGLGCDRACHGCHCLCVFMILLGFTRNFKGRQFGWHGAVWWFRESARVTWMLVTAEETNASVSPFHTLSKVSRTLPSPFSKVHR